MKNKSVQESKNCILLTEHRVKNIGGSDFPETYNDEELPWPFQKFVKTFRVSIVKLKGMEMEFDLVGLSCSIANALRRILLSDVPSMAIETVYVSNNTSIIRDEVFSHRLGLIPLKADPRQFEYRTEGQSNESFQNTTLEFELKLKCTLNPDAKSNLPEDQFKNCHVYSKHLKWIPIGNQASNFKETDVGPVHLDILLNKLRPGHELDLKIHAVKGVGRTHAKFSPVATAFYRMLPEITLIDDVVGEDALKLQKCFSPGVIGIETDSATGEQKAVVVNSRYDSCSRNVLRYDDLKDKVRMGRVRNHFIFTIESTGAIPPNELFLEAVSVLKEKCKMYLKELKSTSTD